MKESKVFYMVFAEGERTPAIKHSTLEGALREAKRIAQKTDNKTYVLKAVKSVMVNSFIIEDLPEAGSDFDIDCK